MDIVLKSSPREVPVTADDEKIPRYLALFGLAPDFSKDELTRAYRTLAKLNHPDVSKDAASAMRMVIINAGYECLTRVAEEGGHVPAAQPKSEDPAYGIYREGFDALSRAFDRYYADGAQARAERMDQFLEELRAAKELLARVIREYPESLWTGDAIDKVMSVNLWLKD